MVDRYRNRVLRAAATVIIAGATVTSSLGLVAPQVARAGTPQRDTYFICPSVSTNNVNGKWVIGTHGAYYVLVPTQGDTGDRVYLTVPVTVESLAQIPAGWALYNSLPSYPNFVGTAMLLEEGIDGWLGSPAGWQEGDMATVVDNGDGTYSVTDLTLGQTITIAHSIPLESATVW